MGKTIHNKQFELAAIKYQKDSLLLIDFKIQRLIQLKSAFGVIKEDMRFRSESTFHKKCLFVSHIRKRTISSENLTRFSYLYSSLIYLLIRQLRNSTLLVYYLNSNQNPNLQVGLSVPNKL